MDFEPHILAGSDTDAAVKLIFGVIVVVFWLFGALISAINKKAEENRRRAAAGQIPPVNYRIPPLVPPELQLSRMAAPARVVQQRPAARRAAGGIAAMPSANLSKSAAATQVTRNQGAAKVVPPSQIGKLLQRPETLRAAFILNEVLSPPLSERERPGGLS